MHKQNITFAIFDVRPTDPAINRVNFDWISRLKPTVDLSVLNKKKKITSQETSDFSIVPAKIVSSSKDALQELELTLSEDIDFNKEIELFGGKLINSSKKIRSEPSYIPALKEDESDNFEKFRDEFSKLISPPPYLPWAPHLRASEGWGPEVSLAENKKNSLVLDLSPAARELEATLSRFKSASSKFDNYQSDIIITPFLKTSEEKTSRSILVFTFCLAATFILTFSLVKTSVLKNNIFQRSNQAYINLNSVQDNISEFKFFEAASAFSLAAKNFELMHQDLKKASAVFKVLDKVTLGGTSDTLDLIEAGKLISQAGLDLAGALEKISGINLISTILDSEAVGKTNILEVLGQFRLNMIQASRNLNQASSLIVNSDSNLIPESEKEKFDEFKARLPEFNDFIEKAINYSDALMIMLGQSINQRYVLLFQNTSELRPTGGFPGSYALIEFDKGVMKEFFVDDIYNPDGQMKEKIIPPRPLQKITPSWGMRDANWFIDFQASAKKIAEFYYKDTKILVDGVAAVNVDLVPEILKITGPLEMAEFGITLSSDNFIVEIQKEVEYQRTKGENQPKQILVEFAPKLLDRLSALNQDQWAQVFNVLVSGIENKNILVYFTDSRLQDFALLNGFAGEIKGLPGRDYLMINHANIMGSKTDAVIDNSVSLSIDNSGNNLHTLEIKRFHKGGEFGFYNKKNNDYVRVLLPDDAELIELNGNDPFEFSPLLDYSGQGFISDPDLEKYESGIQKVTSSAGEIEILSEGGKKVIAFWMVIEPGQSKTVKIKYKTRAQKRIYIQKQPGLKSDFKLIFNTKTLFDEKLSSDKNIGLE
ncbi:MAG: Uncharacterized protein G01um10142_267 [Parcubacteria group bacterium Gr01-1014_2]|nr:MAG: Uncharacterized protein G01um10142_267 [Parcubacteria group bacterium Gr01-1014_2]